MFYTIIQKVIRSKGGGVRGGGGKGMICNLLGIILSIWLLLING